MKNADEEVAQSAVFSAASTDVVDVEVVPHEARNAALTVQDRDRKTIVAFLPSKYSSFRHPFTVLLEEGRCKAPQLVVLRPFRSADLRTLEVFVRSLPKTVAIDVATGGQIASAESMGQPGTPKQTIFFAVAVTNCCQAYFRSMSGAFLQLFGKFSSSIIVKPAITDAVDGASSPARKILLTLNSPV